MQRGWLLAFGCPGTIRPADVEVSALRAWPSPWRSGHLLMKDTAVAESIDNESPSLRQRLLSGPSGPSELLVLQGELTAEQRE